jgi:NitT/TauT family transport system ATP-binding protein
MEAFVDIDGVTLKYRGASGDIVALQDATLKVQRGEFVAVVGPSGCGKSTLMRLVTGLHKPTAGTIAIDGKEVKGPVKMAGMAFQNANMLPWRKVIDNVLLPLEIVEPYRSQFRSRKAEFRAKAEQLLATVGLAGFGDRYPWELSGGMQQRVSLCRSLIHEPALLRDLWQRLGFTVILVTHDLREAAFLADKIYVMSARPGHIVQIKSVPFARPRDLQVTYEKDFGDIVMELRMKIAQVRQS